ncbi:acylphosphatase-1-like protein [Powellomyces hirtus]|nr:acylphosphatase-1-like protein [Powellomyces hirtus]
MANKADLISLTFEVFGKVQGVFFRKHVVDSAVSAGVVGWVRNSHSGTVQGLGQGERSAIEKFKVSLQQGSPSSRVDRVESSENIAIHLPKLISQVHNLAAGFLL